MPYRPYEAVPGAYEFDTPNGPIFARGPDAAQAAMEHDRAAGVEQPWEHYQAISRGDPSPQFAVNDLEQGGEAGSRSDFAPDYSNGIDGYSPTGNAGATEGAGGGPPAPPAYEGPDPASSGGEAGAGGAPSVDPEGGYAGAPNAFKPPPPSAQAPSAQAPSSRTAADPKDVVTAGTKPPVQGGSGAGAARTARTALDEYWVAQEGAQRAGFDLGEVRDERQRQRLVEQNAIDQQYLAAAKARQAEIDQASAAYNAQVSKAIEDFDREKVDPDRLWSSKSVGQKLMLGIAAAFAGSSTAGGENPVLKRLDQQIDRDVKAQIENRNAKGQKVGFLRGQYNDFLAQSRDKDLAERQTALVAKGIVGNQMLAQAMESGSPESIAKAQAFNAQIREEQSKATAELAAARAKAAAGAAGSAAAAAKKQRTITVGGRTYPVAPNISEKEYNELIEQASKVERSKKAAAAVERAPQTSTLGNAARSIPIVGPLFESAESRQEEEAAVNLGAAENVRKGLGDVTEGTVKAARKDYAGPNRKGGVGNVKERISEEEQDLVRRIQGR
jgi:hypothetical protein